MMGMHSTVSLIPRSPRQALWFALALVKGTRASHPVGGDNAAAVQITELARLARVDGRVEIAEAYEAAIDRLKG